MKPMRKAVANSQSLVLRKAESQARAGMQTKLSRRLKQSFDHVMLPGRKQRIEIPRDPLIGQTMVLPTRFGSVITASSGTSIHWLSMRTTYWPFLDPQSAYETAQLSASEKHSP